MLTYSLASNAAPRVNFDEVYARAFNDSRPGAGVKLLRSYSRFEDSLQSTNRRARPLPDPKIGRVNSPALEINPVGVLMRMRGNLRRRRPPTRGTLAVWQQRVVAAYIGDHLAEAIPLHVLAKLVHLSAYYLCRAFKQSFGIPPHRYHINRRMDRAS
jgi:hypothetical protein